MYEFLSLDKYLAESKSIKKAPMEKMA